MENFIYRGILILLAVFLSYSLFYSIYAIYDIAEKLQPIIIIIGSILCILFFLSMKKIIDHFHITSRKIIVFFLVFFFLIGLLLFGIHHIYIPLFDLSILQKEVTSMLENGGHFINVVYYAQYYNQVPITILLYFIYKIGSLLQVGNLRLFATVINAIFLCITAFFTYLSAKRLNGQKWGILTLLFFVLNPIFYLYVSYFYTDTLCLPFAAIACYLFIVGMQSKKYWFCVLLSVLSGFFILCGSEIRIVVLFLLIAMLLQLFIENRNITKKLIIGGSLILGIFVGSLTYSLSTLSFNIPKDKNFEFPIYHWIMYGLNKDENGGWNSKDWSYTYHSGDFEKKKEADLEVIKYRIKDLGISDWLKLIKVKIARVWSNGGYGFYRFTNVEQINKLYEYTLGNKKIFLLYLLQIFKAVILLMCLLATIYTVFHKKESTMLFIYIALFGAFIFYILWEAQDRYALSFLPWMFLLFPTGMACLEKMMHIQNLKISINKKMIRFNMQELKRKGYIIFCSITIFFLIINFYNYSIKKDIYYDTRVIQSGAYGESILKSLSHKTIKQTFLVNKSFNTISIKFLNTTQGDSNYRFSVLNAKEEPVYQTTFTNTSVVHDKYKEFTFPTIKVDGQSKFTVQIQPLSNTNSNIGIATFHLENYSAYPEGALYINDQSTDSTIVFKVQNKRKREMFSKKVYLFFTSGVLFLLLFIYFILFKKTVRKSKQC